MSITGILSSYREGVVTVTEEYYRFIDFAEGRYIQRNFSFIEFKVSKTLSFPKCQFIVRTRRLHFVLNVTSLWLITEVI